MESVQCCLELDYLMGANSIYLIVLEIYLIFMKALGATNASQNSVGEGFVGGLEEQSSSYMVKMRLLVSAAYLGGGSWAWGPWPMALP